MISTTPSTNPPRESWGRLITTLLLVLAALGFVLYSTIVLSIALGGMRQPTSRVATLLIGTTVGELAGFGMLIWLLHRRGSKLPDLGWGQPTRWWALAFGVGIALDITYVIGKWSLTPVIISHALIDVISEPWLLFSFFR